MGELAVEERHRLSVVERDDSIHGGDCGLVGVKEVGILDALGVTEFQALKAQVAHWSLRFADDAQELRRHRNDRDSLPRLFAGAGVVGQLAGAVEEPLPRCVQESG